MDNLRKRKVTIVNACIMCLASNESMDHLLLNCKVAQAVWTSGLGWFECSWTLPCSLQHLFEAWKMCVGSARGKIMWRPSFLAVLWVFLKESLHR